MSLIDIATLGSSTEEPNAPRTPSAPQPTAATIAAMIPK